jgi:CheY-like chemotaxis protein
MKTDTSSKIILMADDDADDRLLAQDALQESASGLEMRFVADGAELMDYLRRRNKYVAPSSAPIPGLIILDLNMPRMDGREALKEIKSDPLLRKIPVVILTTSRADTDISKIYDLGANSFISKPAAFDVLVSTMKSLGDYWFKIVVSPHTNLI